MARLLFLPDDQTYLFFDSPLSAAELAKAIQQGTWQPPEPYAHWLQGKEGHRLRVLRLGWLVVAVFEVPVDLPQEVPVQRGVMRLSRRQLQVLQGLTEGLTSKQIAERLGVTTRRVMMLIADLKARLGASTRAQIVGRGMAMGLCRPRSRGKGG